MTGAITKGSASIIGEAINFTAPQNFEGYSEIGYRITDTNWNIDFLGTVKIYAQSSGGSTTTSPITTIPTITNPVVGNVATTSVSKISILKKLIYVILTGLLLIGGIIYFSFKKAKWILGLIALATVGLLFSVYQYFKKQNEESKNL